MRPWSLRGIMTVYVAAFVGALLIQRGINYTITHRALQHQVDRRLANAAADIISAERTGGRKGLIDRINAAQADHDTADLLFMLVDRSGRRVAGNLPLSAAPPAGYSDFGQEAFVADVAHGRALTRLLPDGDRVVIVSDNDEEDDFDALLFDVQFLGLAVTCAIFVSGVIVITLIIRNRMRSIQHTVDAVIAGDLKNRVPLDGTGSEFDQLAGSFNKMLERMEELMANAGHAAKDVAHELKNPLARLRGAVAALERRAGDDALAPDITDLRVQTDEILELFNSMLRLWEVESGQRREHFASVDLVALAAEAGEAMQAVAEDQGQRLNIVPNGRLVVQGDAGLLRQMAVNLVENAVRHTPPGTAITVETRQGGGQAQLIVRDTGPGIPADALATAMRRFGRLAPARETPGHGLGLALVDAIARLHDGSLTMEDAAPGVRAIVSLPLKGGK